MAISRTRRIFRITLGFLLVLSFSFFSFAAYIYVSVKQRQISLREISPALFTIDVYQHQIYASLQSQDEQLKIAQALYQKGFFSKIYSDSAKEMISSLAESGHAPSQKVHADIIMSKYDISEQDKQIAMNYYTQSADQGYVQAQEKLALLKQTQINN